LTELLLAAAIAAAIIPFIARQEMNRISQARNIAAATEMQTVRDALEKYVRDEKGNFESESTLIEISSLSEYLPNWEKYADMRARVVKRTDPYGGVILRGIVSSDTGNAMRTRTIELLAGGGYGGDAAAIPTRLVRGDNEFVTRVPSRDPDDSKMESDLDMNRHSIMNIGNISASHIKAGTSRIGDTSADSLSVLSEQKFDGVILADVANIIGTADIGGDFSVSELGVSGGASAANANIGNLNARGATANTLFIPNIEFSGGLKANSIEADLSNLSGGILTRKLRIAEKISDPNDPGLFWNAKDRTGSFYDIQLVLANGLMRSIISAEKYVSEAGSAMRRATSNENATASDFIMALSEMRDIVIMKYNDLNLE
jgi:hypothetical protein